MAFLFADSRRGSGLANERWVVGLMPASSESRGVSSPEQGIPAKEDSFCQWEELRIGLCEVFYGNSFFHYHLK